MNKEVYDLLKDASEDAKKIRKRKDNAIAKEKKLKEAFYNRAVKNGKELSDKLFKSLIEEYTNDPISVLNFWGSKTEKKYYTSYPLFKDEYKLSKDDRRLRYYYRNSDNPCCFIVDEKTNETIPIILKKDGFLCMKLHDDLYKDNIRGSVSNEYIRDLSWKAHNKELNDSDFDKSIIDMLNNSYNTLSKKANALQKYLNSLNRNNQIAYIEVYKKLLKKYKLHPNDEDIEVTINLDKAMDLDNPYAVLFNDASSDDKIFNFPYKDNYNIIKCVPVRFSELRKMFRDDMDIGFCNIYLRVDYLYVEFKMLELEKALLNVDELDKEKTL